MGKHLYVTNIPFEATEEELHRLFSVAGRVKSVKLLTDPVSGKPRGVGFVEMSTPKETKDAIESLDDAFFIDRQISVAEARDNPDRQPDKRAPQAGTRRPPQAKRR